MALAAAAWPASAAGGVRKISTENPGVMGENRAAWRKAAQRRRHEKRINRRAMISKCLFSVKMKYHRRRNHQSGGVFPWRLSGGSAFIAGQALA